MTATEWVAIASAVVTAVGGIMTAVAKLVLAAVRELVVGQRDQTAQLVAGHKEVASSLADLKNEIISLGSRVDTINELTGPRRRVEGEPPPVPKMASNGRKG